eukprot:991635-Prorocentrum_minimum.AAC.2
MGAVRPVGEIPTGSRGPPSWPCSTAHTTGRTQSEIPTGSRGPPSWPATPAPPRTPPSPPPADWWPLSAPYVIPADLPPAAAALIVNRGTLKGGPQDPRGEGRAVWMLSRATT